MHIFLTGFMGVGKTSIGKELGTLTQLPFIDLDSHIEEITGKSISQLFKDEGEYRFRTIERDVLVELISKTKSKSIIALGGGTMTSSTNALDIIKNGICIYLYKPWEEIKDYLPKLTNRPLTESKSSEELESIFNKREAFYELSQLKMPINSTFTTKKLAQTLRLSTNR
jgi:shikimate kinase